MPKVSPETVKTQIVNDSEFGMTPCFKSQDENEKMKTIRKSNHQFSSVIN